VELLALGQRHTARHDQVRGLVGEFLRTTQHVALGLLDDGAGVEDGDVGRLDGVGAVVAAVAERPLDLAALAAVRGAPVGLDVVGGHR
jgi:hypothetical protein